MDIIKQAEEILQEKAINDKCDEAIKNCDEAIKELIRVRAWLIEYRNKE
ncbi:MAG: hypothetical protein QME16_00240 [Planctomycetota bacterium]|nr:hypothetical protein [Planctomycetota bacterium]